MIDIIDFVIDIVSFLVSTGIIIWVMLFVLKLYANTNNKERLIKELNKIDSIFRKAISYGVFAFFILLKLIICVILAQGAEPIIYKLNYQLGLGYAEFASYAIAILIYQLIPDFYNPFKTKEGDSRYTE